MKKLNSNSKKRNLAYNGVGSGGGVTPEVIEQLEQDVERSLLGNHVYSTTERVCGEWLDGRNIYESTIVFENTIEVGTSSFKVLVDNTFNADYIVDSVGHSLKGNVPIKTVLDDNNRFMSLAFHTTPIKSITLQYTKNI